MNLQWGSLPLLPLRCILEHLSTEDALAAMSTCRHWRNATLLYEGRKETLKLKAKHLEKNLFLTRIFRRQTEKLHVYLDCSEPELEKFMNFVLPQFFDTVKLQELIFIGPSYIQLNQHISFVKLKRIIIESLIFKNVLNIKKVAFLGCEMGAVKNENDRYTHKHVEYYSRPLSFGGETASDVVMSSRNIGLMAFSTLKHIHIDYEQVNTNALENLNRLPNFTNLSLNIMNKRNLKLRPLDWQRVTAAFAKPLNVGLNIIAVSQKRLDEIIENVLVEGLTLASLKVLFCKSIYGPLLEHVTSLYHSTLRELVWADSPYDAAAYHRGGRSPRLDNYDPYEELNPFVLLCWQCEHLRRLVIHGYWVWQYDLLGFVRLRKTLSHLEVSAISHEQDKFTNPLRQSDAGTVRVLVGDAPSVMDPDYVQAVNEYTAFKWKPVPRSKLHPALRARSTPLQRADYIVREAIASLVLAPCQ